MVDRPIFTSQREVFVRYLKGVDRVELRSQARDIAAWFGAAIGMLSIVVLVATHDGGSSRGTDTDVAGVSDAFLVAGFGHDFVCDYLSAQAGDEDKMAAYISKKDMSLPSGASTFTDSRVEDLGRRSADVSGVSMWWVEVSGIVNAASHSDVERTYYTVAVSVYNHRARALDIPMQTGKPEMGVDLRMDYRNKVDADSALGEAASGFVRSWLTGGSDVERYTASGFDAQPPIPALYSPKDIGEFSLDSITSNVGANGGGKQKAEVRVAVHAVDPKSAYLVREFSYALTLHYVQGRWQVSGINKVPRILVHHTDATPSSESQTPEPSSPELPEPVRS